MSRDNSVHIGGDAHGPVVVGDSNRVDARTPDPEQHAGPEQPPGPAMHNTADHGATLFAVMNGDQYIDRAAPEAGPPAASS